MIDHIDRLVEPPAPQLAVRSPVLASGGNERSKIGNSKVQNVQCMIKLINNLARCDTC